METLLAMYNGDDPILADHYIHKMMSVSADENRNKVLMLATIALPEAIKKMISRLHFDTTRKFEL